MKTTWMLAAVAVAGMGLCGCDTPTPSALSVEALASDQDAVAVPGITGTWEKGDEALLIKRSTSKDSPNTYDIVYLSGERPLGYSGRVFHAGDGTFMDVTPEGNNDFRVPGHAIARIWLDGTGFRWAFLDSDWFKQQLTAALPTYKSGDGLLILAPGTSVRSAVEKYGNDPKACGNVTVWQKMM